MIIIGGLFSLLILTAFDGAEAHAWVQPSAAVLLGVQGGGAPGGEGIFRWEQDLRWFAFRLLKSVRRTWIRFTRLVRRSADYWLGWALSAFGLVIAGGGLSAVDRRMIALARERGMRAAMEYAWIGLVVYLRLLRDRRISLRVRALVPLAVLYGVSSSGWLRFGSSLMLDLALDAFVVVAASRWFVRRCPDAIIEEHAARVRARARGRVRMSSSQQRS